MLQRIYHQINSADLIIADMTGKNPNVFYEVGYAHALDKKVILLTKNGEDIPFDLKHYPFIIYENISGLKEELKKRIPFLLNTPKKVKAFPIQCSFENPNKIIKRVKNDNPSNDFIQRILLKVTVQNVSDIVQTIKIGFIQTVQSKFVSVYPKELIHVHNIPNSKDVIYLHENILQLLPFDIDTIEIVLMYRVDKATYNQDRLEDYLVVRVFTENGYNDFKYSFVQEIEFFKPTPSINAKIPPIMNI
jgi:hypothetical protein